MLSNTSSGTPSQCSAWHQSKLDSQSGGISNWAEVINCANLGMEVMPDGNVHNCARDRAAEFSPMGGCSMGTPMVR